jgi:transposase
MERDRRAQRRLRETARRIAAEDPITTVDNAAERTRRQVGRPSKAEAFRDVLVRALTEDPGLRSVELLHRARLAGYTGGKSAVYALAQTLRVRAVTPLVRFERLPSEFSQHDFGEVWVTYQDGTESKVHFFASRLKYSRWVEVSLVPDERVETLVRALVEHLAAFGGIPLVTVFDRPKTIALKWGRDGVVTEWNPTCAGVALDLGGVEVCWTYRPQEKGSVENLVGWVKHSFFRQRRFLDHVDLERQLREWLTEANTIRPSRATGVPSARITEDRARLRPLKVAAADLALRIPVSVSPTGVVIHDGHPYSMPPDAIGLPGTLYLYRDRVRIIAGRFCADHERKFQPGDSSILPEHRAQRVAAVSGKVMRPDRTFAIEVDNFCHSGMGRFATAPKLGTMSAGAVAKPPYDEYGVNSSTSTITQLLNGKNSFAAPPRPFEKTFARFANFVAKVPSRVQRVMQLSAMQFPC